MSVIEEPRYTRDFADPDKLSSANAIEVRFRDGTRLPKVEIEYPMGHPRRRAEFHPMLEAKFRNHLYQRYSVKRQAAIIDMCMDRERLASMPANRFMSALTL